MSVAGREAITAETAARLLATGLGDVCDDPQLHYVAPNGRPAPDAPGWRLVRSELGTAHVNSKITSMRFKGHGSNPWLDFAALLLSWSPDLDALFFEDDVWPCQNGPRQMARVEVPRLAGVVSFFDFRNEWPRPGLWPAPAARPLWGAQALRFPARVIPALQELARKGTPLKCWDVWISQSVELLGLQVIHYAPSLVQHVGAWSMYAPGKPRPEARNYPGDDFDALGPCSDPIVPGSSRAPSAVVCPMHNEIHDGGATCPITR